jgi:hypothetical protein
VNEADESGPTAAEVGGRLRIVPRSVATLQKMGVLSSQPRGTARIFSEERVAELELRKPPPLNAPAAWVVRLGPPLSVTDDDGQVRQIGWRAVSNADEQDEQDEAMGRYWKIARPNSYVGEALVGVAPGGFVVAVRRIVRGYSSWQGARFELEAPTPEQADAYLDRRFEAMAGPVLFHYPERSQNRSASRS